MSRNNDQEWKAGDGVYVHSARQEMHLWRRAVVERVTPSGRPVVEGKTFNPNGSIRTAASRFNTESIERATAELMAKVEAAVDFSNAKIDALRAIERFEKAVRGHGMIGVDAEQMKRASACLNAILLEGRA